LPIRTGILSNQILLRGASHLPQFPSQSNWEIDHTTTFYSQRLASNATQRKRESKIISVGINYEVRSRSKRSPSSGWLSGTLGRGCRTIQPAQEVPEKGKHACAETYFDVEFVL
jgi:hypothetical protein